MFVNGNTTQSKVANWDLLARFFRRNKITISQESMDAVMHGYGYSFYDKKLISSVKRIDYRMLPLYSFVIYTC
jgi:hypothetical protein